MEYTEKKQVVREMVSVPVDSLPPDYVKDHLVDNQGGQPERPQPNNDSISKRVAAIEVLATIEEMKQIAMFGLGGAWIAVIVSYFEPMFAAGVAVLASGLIGFKLLKQINKEKYLKQEYRV